MKPEEKDKYLQAQLAINKLQSVRKYIIWMVDSPYYVEMAKLLNEVQREVIHEHYLYYNMDQAIEYSSKWREFYLFYKERVKEERREREYIITGSY